MKKVLVSLLVLALAMSSVFAAVKFNGELVAGYNFNYDANGSGKWGYHVMGQDGDDSNTTKLKLSFADDNGLWTVSTEGQMIADGRISGDFAVDMLKLFDVDSDLSVKLGLSVNDEQTVLRAYSNQSGNNFDRFRTPAGGLWTNVDISYAGLVEVLVAGAPKLEANTNGDKPGQGGNADHLVGGGDFAVSAKVTPVDGLAMSAGYVLYGKNDNGTGSKGIVGGAVNVDVSALAGLDFSLGASASYKYGFANKQNVVAATVYGGVDVVDLAVEYAYLSGSDEHYLYAGANFNVVENMLLDAYFGANNLTKFADTFFVGGDIGYTLKNVTFALGVEYAATTAGNGAYNYDYNGLSIVPKVSVSF